MFKILILAYLIGQDPVDTQKIFVLNNNFETMEECKQELLLKTRDNNTYGVLYDFIVVNNYGFTGNFRNSQKYTLLFTNNSTISQKNKRQIRQIHQTRVRFSWTF